MAEMAGKFAESKPGFGQQFWDSATKGYQLGAEADIANKRNALAAGQLDVDRFRAIMAQREQSVRTAETMIHISKMPPEMRQPAFNYIAPQLGWDTTSENFKSFAKMLGNDDFVQSFAGALADIGIDPKLQEGYLRVFRDNPAKGLELLNQYQTQQRLLDQQRQQQAHQENRDKLAQKSEDRLAESAEIANDLKRRELETPRGGVQILTDTDTDAQGRTTSKQRGILVDPRTGTYKELTPEGGTPPGSGTGAATPGGALATKITLAPGQSKNLADYDLGVKQIDAILGKLDQKDKYGNYVYDDAFGPTRAAAEEAANAGMTPGYGKDDSGIVGKYVKRKFGQMALDYMMTPEQKELRADVYDRVATQMHNLYGGQLTANEVARAGGFLVTPSDTLPQVRAKLTAMRNRFKFDRDAISSSATPSSSGSSGAAAPKSTSGAAAASKLKPLAPAVIAKARKAIAENPGAADAIRERYKQSGYDPSGI